MKVRIQNNQPNAAQRKALRKRLKKFAEKLAEMQTRQEDYTTFYQSDDLQIVVAVENGQIVGSLMPIRWTKGDEI